MWDVTISRPREVPGPTLSTQMGRTSTLDSHIAARLDHMLLFTPTVQPIHTY